MVTKSLGFGKRAWGIAPKPTPVTPTKLNVKRPPATPLEEMVQVFQLITG
jgi:hypothetical protein